MYDVALCDVIVKDSLVSDCESVDALKKWIQSVTEVCKSVCDINTCDSKVKKKKS